MTGVQIANTGTTDIINQIRIDNNRIVNCGIYGVRFLGVIYGLVDNNQLDGNGTVFRLLGAHDNSWVDPLQIGSANYIYIEDNTIDNNSMIISSGWGA